MLKLTDIKKDYKVASESVHALKGVSLEFRKNEFVCILGQSGCGKTTLLNIIGGLDHYTSGDLVIQGKSTKDFSDRDWDVYRNHRIGFIFQSYNLIPHQTVLGNVELALTIAGVSREERRERARQALERVGLGKEIHKRPNQLSGGQMQRVAIARALVNNPDILLADEPTGALDSETSVQIMELIKEISGERLVIMVTHNPELAELYASRIVRLKDGIVESDSNPYDGAEIGETEPAKEESAQDIPERASENGKKKKKKKLRARMSFLTSLALSARNLLTKKGRTIITSIAGSIGIISVCLVLALSSGFNHYIKRTEEDMLSYYPVEVTEEAFDLSSLMFSFTAPKDMPDMSELDDEVYVDSFLTGLANGITVHNTITDGYLDYVNSMDPKIYSAVQYGYGVGLSDGLFTKVTTGGVDMEKNVLDENGNPVLDGQGNPVTETVHVPEAVQNLSLTELKSFYISELLQYAKKYAPLIQYVELFGNIVNKMPGSGDFSDANYAKYVLSQYDVLGGEAAHFPTNANEAVLVIGSNNEATDLTLAQLGLLPEKKFLSLFDLGGEKKDENEKGYMTVNFSEIIGKEYVLYGNNAIYSPNPSYNPMVADSYAYTYNGSKTSLEVGTDADGTPQGIPLTITAVLRLKDGLTYGCLSNGLNITEKAVNDYIALNMKSDVVEYINKNSSKAVYEGEEYLAYFGAPAKNLLKYYPYEQEQSLPNGAKIKINYTMSDEALRYVGGKNTPNSIRIYATDFDGKEEMLDYLDAWNDLCERYDKDESAWVKAHEAEKEQDAAKYEADRAEAEKNWGYRYTYLGEDGKEVSVTLREGDKITYTDRVGLLMGMMQTMLDVITVVLVAFTAISLVVSSVMIGIITYVSVVERIKEIGVLRSLGARKQDIRNLFNAETFIIGLAAGLIGIVVTYLLSIAVNAIILALTGIGGIAALPPLTAFIMVVVSVLLTLISGLIPAQAAAKKDPVIALRTE